MMYDVPNDTVSNAEAAINALYAEFSMQHVPGHGDSLRTIACLLRDGSYGDALSRWHNTAAFFLLGDKTPQQEAYLQAAMAAMSNIEAAYRFDQHRPLVELDWWSIQSRMDHSAPTESVSQTGIPLTYKRVILCIMFSAMVAAGMGMLALSPQAGVQKWIPIMLGVVFSIYGACKLFRMITGDDSVVECEWQQIARQI